MYCPTKIAPYAGRYYASLLGKRSSNHKARGESRPHQHHSRLSETGIIHLLARELWKCAPEILENTIPQLEAELTGDDEWLRADVVETIGDMISGVGASGLAPYAELESLK